MLRKGQRVVQPTKKVGQHPRTGTVLEVKGEFVEVKWDDGHVSTVTGAYLRPAEHETASTR